MLRQTSSGPQNGLSITPPKVRTLGVFKLSFANLHNGALLLTGSRSTIYKDKTGKPTLLGDTPIVIKIAFNGADPTQVLPGLKQQLFFSTLQAAIAAIPLQDRQMLYPTDEPPAPAGLGLDEQASKSVSNYRFKPATCDGTAVKTPLMIEQTFTIPPL
jgi:hypothetical protein